MVNGPLCVSCDSNSLRGAIDEGEKAKKKTLEKTPSIA